MKTCWTRWLLVGAVIAPLVLPAWTAAAPPAATVPPAAPAVPTPATTPPADPHQKLSPALTHYMGREIAPAMGYQHAAWLLRPERQQQEDWTSLLKLLHLKPGQVVCDLGAGNGFYTLKMAPQVLPGGRILAVDIQPEMLRLLNDRARVAKINNVEPVLGTLIDPKLPEGQVDMVLCVDAYHEFSHPVHMLRAIRKSLSPHGRLVLVEFRAEDPQVAIKKLHKMSKAQILKELPPNGLKLVEQFDKLPWQHVMYFERDEAWREPPEEK